MRFVYTSVGTSVYPFKEIKSWCYDSTTKIINNTRFSFILRRPRKVSERNSFNRFRLRFEGHLESGWRESSNEIGRKRRDSPGAVKIVSYMALSTFHRLRLYKRELAIRCTSISHYWSFRLGHYRVAQSTGRVAFDSVGQQQKRACFWVIKLCVCGKYYFMCTF